MPIETVARESREAQWAHIRSKGYSIKGKIGPRVRDHQRDYPEIRTQRRVVSRWLWRRFGGLPQVYES